MLRHSLFGIVKVCFESIQFHLMKQIEILLDDYGTVIKSDSDIKKIEEMVRNQGISPRLELEWYVSNNPLCLIKRMIETSSKGSEVEGWIKAYKGTKKGKNLRDFYVEYESIRDTAFGGKLETNVLKYEELVQAYVRKYCGEIYCLYQFLFEENGRALE